MLIDEIINIKSGKNELKKFGVTSGIVLGILGGLYFWRDINYYIYFLILSALFLGLGLVQPTILKPVYKAWMIVAVVLGWSMTWVILIVLYYCVFTLLGIFGRLFGKTFLDMKFDEHAESYWIPKHRDKTEKKEYEKQY